MKDPVLHSGELYDPMEASIVDEQLGCLELLYDYNATRPREQARRAELLRKMLAEVGENCYIEPPFHANWGGRHVHFGKNVYANFNLTLVDDTHIYVGDYTMFGPNVTVCTAAHPILPELREKGLQYNAPVHIGRNCWIGAGAILLPGVTVGDNSVIGAGSVVTKDVPANVVAVGNPCRVLRPIGEKDRTFYFRNLRNPPGYLEPGRVTETVPKGTQQKRSAGMDYRTEQLILHFVTEDDLAEVARTWPSDHSPISEEEAKGAIAYMRGNYRKNAEGCICHLCLAVCAAEDPRTIMGWCGLDGSSSKAEPEIFILLDEPYQNKGYGTQCVKELLRIASEDFSLQSVHGGCAKDNIASRRVMEKGGMVQYAEEENGDPLFRYSAKRKI